MIERHSLRGYAVFVLWNKTSLILTTFDKQKGCKK